MRLASLAWRNARRNVRRTALTAASIALGVAAVVFAWALFDGSNEQMISNMASNLTGFVQVHRAGWADDPSLDRAFDPGALPAGVGTGLPGIVAIAPRLEATALVSSSAAARGVRLVGVDPASEPGLTALHTKLAAGRYLAGPGEILLGSSLARALRAPVGGEVAILADGARGTLGAARYRVAGIYDTGNDASDGQHAFVSLADARDLLGLPEEVTALAMRLSDRRASAAAVASLESILGPGFEVRDWKALLPEVAREVAFHEGVSRLLMGLLLAIVFVGVANGVFMSVSERTRELGVLLALGTSAGQVFRLVVYEGALVAALGLGAGSLLGLAVVAWAGVVGLDFSATADAVQAVPGAAKVLYPSIRAQDLLALGAAVASVAVAAAVYPALRTARRIPVEAIRGTGVAPGRGARPHGPRRGLLARLALRNLARHRARTALTGTAIVFGVAAFVFLGAVANGYRVQMIEGATGIATGDAQVQHPDFRTDLRPELALPDGAGLLARIRAAGIVAAAAPRVEGVAVVSTPARSENVALVGVDPEAEREVTLLHRAVRIGTYLAAAGDPGIVIGRRLAERLRVRVGERVVVTTQDVSGGLASDALVVRGVFETGSDGFDGEVAHVALGPMQRLLGLARERLTGIALRTVDRETMAEALAAVDRLAPEGAVRVRPWQELMPEVAQMSVILRGGLAVVMLVVFVMVGVVVMNTVLMSVLERTREFGVMLALGSAPSLVVRVVVLESLAVGGVGAVAGIALGVAAASAFAGGGIDLRGQGMTAGVPGVTGVVFPALSPEVLLAPALLLPVLVLAASAYPAARAARLAPVEALRSV
jgi:ABC-type lipoprotein release transport system permease subunit